MANSDSEPPLVRPPDTLIDPEAAGKPNLYDRIGGRPVVEAIIDRLYTAIEADPTLRSLFPDDLAPGRLHQQWFFEEWLGGERRYTARRGSPRLGRRRRGRPRPGGVSCLLHAWARGVGLRATVPRHHFVLNNAQLHLPSSQRYPPPWLDGNP